MAVKDSGCEHDAVECKVCRVFGPAGANDAYYCELRLPSRTQFIDTFQNAIDLCDANADKPEYKGLKEAVFQAYHNHVEGPFSPRKHFTLEAARKWRLIDEEKSKGLACSIAKYILMVQPMISVVETDELLFYYNGVYLSGGERQVHSAVEGLLQGLANNHFVKEVVGHIVRSRSTSITNLLDDSHFLCLENGVLDLSNRQLDMHSPDHLFTTQLPIEFRPHFECPAIDSFFSEIADPADVPLLHEIPGYLLQPGYPLGKATALIGSGDNGKSTYQNLITSFLGEANTAHASLQSLDDDRFSAADLYRKKANISADISARDLRNTGRFKQLTGGDIIRCERKFGQPFDFKNRAKLMFSANTLPQTNDDSDGFYKRWLLPIFPNTFPLGSLRRDENKLAHITTPQELSGLLNQALAAYSRVIERGGFTNSLTAAENRLKWSRLCDSLCYFIEERCTLDSGETFEEEGVRSQRSGSKTLKSAFAAEYVAFCREKNLQPIADSKIKARLHKLTFGAVTEGQVSSGDGRKVWRNIRLNSADGKIGRECQSTL